MAHTETPAVDSRLTELLQIATDLRDLPAQEFKARLKADLQRSASGTIRACAVPPGHHSATPCLVVRNAPQAIEFYKQAFGATELMRLADPDGKVVHAEIQIGDSPIAISDEFPDWGNNSPQALGGSPVIIQVYVEDVDGIATQAVAAGAKVIFPVADQFYGDRAGRLADPFGHIWIVATHLEDVTPDEMRDRAEAFMSHAAQPAPTTTEGAYTVEPSLPVLDAAGLLEFLQQAFAAQEIRRDVRPDGSIAHAEVRIGDSVISAADADMVRFKPMPTALHLYVPDADAAYARALRAGATSSHEPVDQPYGDREASVQDPCGNYWYIATHKHDAAETARRSDAYIPEGLHSVTSYLHPQGAPRLIDFLQRAFGAEEAFRHQAPDGTVVHAKIRIGGSVVEMGEAHGPYQPMPTVYHLYVQDTDAVYRRALAAGGVSLSEPADQPWGYRNAGVQDPGGNQWWINTPTTSAAGKATGSEEPTNRQAEPSPRTVTPFLLVPEVGKTIEFLKAAFDAEVLLFDRGGDPPHDHAELRIGDSMLMMGEAISGFPPTSAAFYLHVPDVDAAYARAIRAGATAQQAPKEMPWGHRMAHVRDAVGNSWFIAAHKKDGGS